MTLWGVLVCPKNQFIIGHPFMKLQYYHFKAVIACMSFFLLSDSQIDRVVLKQYQLYREKCQKQEHPQLTYKQEVNLEAELKKIAHYSTHFFTQTNIKQLLIASIPTTLQNYKNMVSIQLNKRTRRFRIYLDIISPRQTYFQVGNTRCLCQLAMKVNHFLNSQPHNLVQVSFNMANGAFRMMFPLYASSEANFTPGRQSILQYIYKNYISEFSLRLLQFIVHQSNRQFYIEKNVKLMDITNKYMDILHVRTQITESPSFSEAEAKEMERIRKFDMDQTLKNYVKNNPYFNKLNEFYQYQPSYQASSIHYSHFEFAHDEENVVRNKISMPVLTKPKTTAQNILILNYIYVSDLHSMKLTKVDQGGFSSIFLTQMKYICVYPTPGYDIYRFNLNEMVNHKNILQKKVIVKREEEDCGFSRNYHQIQIIKTIKDSSIFFPKYYIILNKPNPYSKSVIMDYVPLNNLNEYMSSHLQSMTLRTKLHLIYSTIQALRFLRDQKIVHLDLKPNNIMIYWNLLVKLIDFGQSYQAEVCSKKHKPGFSIPYSSPQVFSNETKHFTSKSDVFSLGVIMFEILYRSYPYDIFEETELIDDVMANYLQKWLFVPEQFEKYGDVKILRILNACISKCLSPVAAHRPELDWLAIVVRHCLEYIN